MTREEQKKEKLKKEKQFIESVKGKALNQQEKSKFRETTVWKDFRKELKEKRKVDAITGRKLTKTWNCHHERFDSRLYTDLNDNYFLCLNNQMHDLLHVCVSETIKNPQFMKRLSEIVDYHIRLNNNKDVRDFRKEYEKDKQRTK